MLSKDEKQILQWRRERTNRCQFPTQQAYDNTRSEIQGIKAQLQSGMISEGQARVLLVHYHKYGEQGARKVVERWCDGR